MGREARVIGFHGQGDFVSVNRSGMGKRTETEDCDERNPKRVNAAIADVRCLDRYRDRAGQLDAFLLEFIGDRRWVALRVFVLSGPLATYIRGGSGHSAKDYQ